MKGHNYSEAQQDFIRTSWADGLSAANIAHRFNREFGAKITRNGIIGKAMRMKLSPHNASSSTKAHSLAKRLATMRAKGVTTAPKPKKPVLALPEPPSEEPKPLGAPGIHLFQGCRWIAGDDPKTWRFCGHPQKAGTAYCEAHRIKSMPQPHGNQPKRPQTFMNTDRQFR